MAERRQPVARVRLHEPGRRYLQRYDGFGYHAGVAEAWRGGALSCNAVVESGYLSGAGVVGQSPSPAAFVPASDDLDLMVCRPFLDASQPIGLAHFEVSGGQWRGLPGLGIGSEVRLYQYDGRASTPTGAVSRFTLPRNPVVCVSLHRWAPSATHPWAETPPCTELQLGVGGGSEWSLVLPYGGPAIVQRRVDGVWERVANAGRTTRLSSLEGTAPGSRVFVWIAVWNGKLVISTDGFADDLWVCPTGAGQVEVSAGRLGLWHNAGQWAFSVIPVGMVTATVDSAPIDAGYDTEACSGEVFVSSRGLSLVTDPPGAAGTVAVRDSTLERTDLTEQQRAWAAVLVPAVHECTNPPFVTCTSPELYSVQIGQYPEVVDTGLQAWREISDDVMALETDASAGAVAAVAQLWMDNTLGQYAALAEYQECSLQAGWVLHDGRAEYAPSMHGYLVEPEQAIDGSPSGHVEARVVDALTRLRDEKCDGRSPVFDGWSVSDAVRWVLGRCSVPTEGMAIEDTGVLLSQGDPRRPVWEVEPGRPWCDFLSEIAEFDHLGELFCDANGVTHKACRFCRQARTSETVLQHDGRLEGPCGDVPIWDLYTRAQESDGVQISGAVVSVERPRRSLSASGFANHVTVCGMAPDGTPVRSVAWDPGSIGDVASDVYVGWRKMAVRALETYTTEAEANRLAQGLLRDRVWRPEFIRVDVPLEPAIAVGDVARIHGGERVGVAGRYYRITGVHHSVGRDRGGAAVTRVSGQWLKDGS